MDVLKDQTKSDYEKAFTLRKKELPKGRNEQK